MSSLTCIVVHGGRCLETVEAKNIMRAEGDQPRIAASTQPPAKSSSLVAPYLLLVVFVLRGASGDQAADQSLATADSGRGCRPPETARRRSLMVPACTIIRADPPVGAAVAVCALFELNWLSARHACLFAI
jgi:hypothetical protein